MPRRPEPGPKRPSVLLRQRHGAPRRLSAVLPEAVRTSPERGSHNRPPEPVEADQVARRRPVVSNLHILRRPAPLRPVLPRRHRHRGQEAADRQGADRIGAAAAAGAIVNQISGS